MKFVNVLGRMIFGGLFLYNGINHFKQAEALTGYAASKKLPNPDLMVMLSGVALSVAGVSLVFGLKPRFGALTAAGFLAAATPQMHDFWNAQDAGQKQNDLINFSKNMALLGGALAIASHSCECD